ncbi:MAG: hypothetical protein AAGF23_02290 [Acidobacteriota bacterium]
MDLLVTVSLFVLAASAVAIGVMLTGIAAEVRKTRRAIERLGESDAVEEALWPNPGWIGVEGSGQPVIRALETASGEVASANTAIAYPGADAGGEWRGE